MGFKFPATFCVLLFLILSACSGKDDAVNVDELSEDVTSSEQAKSGSSSSEKTMASSDSKKESCGSEEESSSSVTQKSEGKSGKLLNDDDVVIEPSGTYDCSKYKCVTTEFLNQELLETGKYGEFLDKRDRQVYKTIQIGDQVWMAQNLNFNALMSSCYNDSVEYCEKYGRLYTWMSAMDTARVFTTNAKGCGYDRYCDPDIILPAQGVCPEGWHMPSSEEWDVLAVAVGKSRSTNSLNVLQSKEGWCKYGRFHYEGDDEFGFSAAATIGAATIGYGELCGEEEGISTIFWSSFDESLKFAGIRYINYDETSRSDSKWADKNGTYSVRCIKGYAQKDTAWKENSYAVVPSGTYDCTKYKCVTTEYLNQDFLESGKYGEVLDERDGQVYKTIQIGDQVWMAQNLNYKTAWADSGYCYNDVQDSCDAMGRLYTWEHGRRLCPVRWHVASWGDWNKLLDFVGDAKLLFSQSEKDGTDPYGFSARSSGEKNSDGYSFSQEFWTSTNNNGSYAWRIDLFLYGLEKCLSYYAFPIRCIENDPADPD